jgi:dolichol-phosphate mannosyltransferase
MEQIMNRMADPLIRILFGIPLNETTIAFKAYRRAVIEACEPVILPHFNQPVEIPLKANVRGYSRTVVPITCRNRRYGAPKLKLKEMGSRYFLMCLYVWLEKNLSRGDYIKRS